MATVDEGKALLRKTNEDGVSVYSHLTEVLATLLATKNPNALDALEGVSLACKKKHFSPATAAAPEVPPEVPAPPPEAVAAMSAYHEASAELVKPKVLEMEGEVTVEDVLGQRALFECAGVAFSDAETYRIHMSILKLQQEKKLSYVRFFGKVLGTTADYLVVEATWAEPPEPPEDAPPPPPGAPVEESGTGANTYVYFVTNDPSAPWTVLPDVTPQQIVASKLIRKYLTGDLDAPVRAYPPFPGKEKEFLRTQLARLATATTIIPVGMKKMEEGAEPGTLPIDNDAEDYVPAATDDLALAEGWCTKGYGLLDIGRTTNLPEEEEELEEGQVSTKPTPQPHLEPLTPLTPEAWTVSTATHGGPTVALARSLLWPGAYSAYQNAGKKVILASLYVGYAVETLSAPFTMQAPPPFASEPDELVEQADAPLDEENVAVIEAAKAALAEEAANLPDEEPMEGGY